MAQVEDGDTVKVHYTGKFEDGTVFDTSGRQRFDFRHIACRSPVVVSFSD
jgi:FKBP-type peptidyl-prolyl cis-trans isomerase